MNSFTDNRRAVWTWNRGPRRLWTSLLQWGLHGLTTETNRGRYADGRFWRGLGEGCQEGSWNQVQKDPAHYDWCSCPGGIDSADSCVLLLQEEIWEETGMFTVDKYQCKVIWCYLVVFKLMSTSSVQAYTWIIRGRIFIKILEHIFFALKIK